MEDVRIRLQVRAIFGLQFLQLLDLGLAWVGGKIFADKQVPNLLAARSRIERFILGVADAAKCFVRLRRFGAVTFSDQLHHAFAMVDAFAQQFAQIAALSSENVLPNRFVTEKR